MFLCVVFFAVSGKLADSALPIVFGKLNFSRRLTFSNEASVFVNCTRSDFLLIRLASLAASMRVLC